MTVPSVSDWDMQALRRRLGTRAIGLDLAAALDRWRSDGRAGDAGDFLQWVLATQAEEQVMVTAILPPRLANARVPTVSIDPTVILDAGLGVEATVILTPATAPDPTVIGLAPADATVITPPPPSPTPAPLDATIIDAAPSHASIPDATIVTPPPVVSVPAPSDVPRTETSAAPRYVILGEAGKGGMAVVHIARDLELVRKVALKRLAGSAAAHQEVQARFLREVQISAQLDHPNIVPVYGLEVGPEGAPAYAMKFVQGQTLEAFLKDTRAFYERDESPDEAHTLTAALEHFLKVCDAIAYAHDKGVVHRDLKPANVMIGRHNEIYVMDWGICRVLRLPDLQGEGIEGLDAAALDDADTHTRIGTVVGTARYMAPEQAQGRNDEIGPATDQYALGLMLYEIATLQPPYEGRTIVDLLAQASKAEVRPVRHAFTSGRIPREVEAIIGRATSADASARYRDVRAFATDIRRYLRGDAVEAKPDTFWQKAQRNVARHRQAALTGIVALIAVMALGAVALMYRHERALAAADARERELTALVDHVATKGDLLQTRFLELQGEIDAMASAAALAIQHASQSPSPFYWVDDFFDAARRPDDVVAVTGDTDLRSFNFGAWILAPGTSRAAVTPSIRRLLHLRPYRNELFHRARVLLGQPADGAVEATVVDLRRSGVDSFVIGLASGVTLHLPGHAGLPRTLDPRSSPWYRLAAGHAGGQWGEPSLDATGADQRLLVPIAQAIRADDGRELGVTAMLLSLDHIVRNLIGDAPAAGVRATLLLDANQRVLASSGMLDPERAADSQDVRLESFPDPTLATLLQGRQSGYFETSVFGQRDVIAFDTVQPVGWTLVKVTSAGVIEARMRAVR